MAIMTAAAMVLLVTVAAMSVDLGQAFVKKQDVQKLADFAALAGAAGTNLPGTTQATNCSYGVRANATDQAIVDASSYLGSGPWVDAITASTLVDCDLTNGEAFYGRLSWASGSPVLTHSKYELTVLTPSQRVDFDLARVIGATGIDVQGRARVGVGTPGSEKIFPAFATDGCDWGQKTIFAPASSSTGPSFTPDVSAPAEKNMIDFDLSIENPSPDSVPVNPATTLVTITGTNMDKVTAVGFFKEDPAAPPQEVPKASFDSQTPTTLTFSVPEDTPAGFAATAGLWWVRVKAPKSPTNPALEWSEVKSGTTLKTVPFEVGESFLRCAGVAAGSYGDINLPRSTGAPSTWNAMNMATNLQIGPPRLSLSTYPGAPTSVYGASSAPNLCVTSDARTIYSSSTPVDIRANTNCVDNGTGLTANTATDGLISGVRSGATLLAPGRLDAAADSACAPRKTVSVSAGTFTINDDVLTCFMQPGITVGAIASKSYSGGPVLDCSVFDSPRFFYQPVLQVRPSGGSNKYSIVDFRPAFISEQDPGAIYGSGSIGQNGVTITGGQVTQLDVVFFHPSALSRDCSNSFGPALGGTTALVTRLVD